MISDLPILDSSLIRLATPVHPSLGNISSSLSFRDSAIRIAAQTAKHGQGTHAPSTFSDGDARSVVFLSPFVMPKYDFTVDVLALLE